jgi:hypothetical protein
VNIVAWAASGQEFEDRVKAISAELKTAADLIDRVGHTLLDSLGEDRLLSQTIWEKELIAEDERG